MINNFQLGLGVDIRTIKAEYKISGYLTYNKTALLPLAGAGVTVYLKSSPEPIPPATTPIPTVLQSVHTDVNGYFELNAANGVYYLYAANTASWSGVAPNDTTNLQRFIAGLTPNTIEGNALRIKAMDINQDGIVDSNDVTPLQRRISNLLPNTEYKIASWVFENPMVSVSGTDIIQDFKGNVSGDANGSYPSN